MKTLTYGHLPSYEEFKAAFERECPDSTYAISHGSKGPDWRPPEGSFRVHELFHDVERLTKLEESGEVETERMREGQEDSPGSWASSILYTLGFEWV